MTFTDRFVGFFMVVHQATMKLGVKLKRTLMRRDAAAGEVDDPVLAFLAQVPVDDEPVTADDERSIAEGRDAYRRGESESAADAKRQTLATGKTERVVPV